ncbi:hypothetical protein [Burkholderia oklahomensis]|uniref:hypothetical protein n=1 Tax=Burkholderia oklahomensis TaxID=342113 RepID=UPI001E411062|nr:hypothetical protein [Burkholderia oklahomensis]
MSVDLAAANLPIVASSFAAQDISQGAGQLSESHGATRASGSPAQHRGHDAVQKVSDLIHASARRRAAATRKRPPGKAKKNSVGTFPDSNRGEENRAGRRRRRRPATQSVSTP